MRTFRVLEHLPHHQKCFFFGEGIKTNVQKFVVKCVVFQLNKGETIQMSALLQLLAIPSQLWEEASMDFIIGLPKSKGKNAIMVVVD
jgi:hypothetical protein